MVYIAVESPIENGILVATLPDTRCYGWLASLTRQDSKSDLQLLI